VCDGGSTDGTLAVLREWQARLPLIIVESPAANISAGRNRAIERACGPLIAVVDAGLRLERAWLATLLRPLVEEWDGLPPAAPEVHQGRALFVGGPSVPEPRGAFEIALAATTMYDPDSLAPERFVPTGRSALFPKWVWQLAGGYPEWLDYCEDLVFAFAVASVAPRSTWRLVPEARVHFRPRANIGEFARQYFRYGRGDGKAGLWPGRHLVRYATYLGLVPFVALLGRLHGPGWWLALAGGAIATLWTPYRRLMKHGVHQSALDRLIAVVWVPLIRVLGDAAKMAGYPIGLRWRLVHRTPIQRNVVRPGALEYLGREGRWREHLQARPPPDGAETKAGASSQARDP
jgi:hypothetical protein